MINSIVNTFREQARCHKAIRSFYYNRNYETGSGNENHPLFWLEDPIGGRNKDNIFINSVNFSILIIPAHGDEIVTLQNLAFSIGLNIIERIKQNKSQEIKILPSWSYMLLRDYYDNDACGCRFSVDFSQLNMLNLCLIDEQFSDDNNFDKNEAFDLNLPEGPEIYKDKLPVFDLKILK